MLNTQKRNLTKRTGFVWIPRVLGILYMLFLSVFALDVFSESKAWQEILLSLFIHLMPSVLVLTALILSWKKVFLGFVLFLTLGFISMLFFHTYKNLASFMFISFPMFLISISYLISAKVTDNL